MKMRRSGFAAVAAMVALWLGPTEVGAAERHLWSGLAYLRAGAMLEAQRDLTRYRDEAPNDEVRQKVDRALPLLTRSLSDDVRTYIASTLEEAAARRGVPRPVENVAGTGAPREAYWSRMFPIFP